MPEDLTAIKREKINREARSGLICTNGMGERRVNGKIDNSGTPTGNLVMEKGAHGQSVPAKDKAKD